MLRYLCEAVCDDILRPIAVMVMTVWAAGPGVFRTPARLARTDIGVCPLDRCRLRTFGLTSNHHHLQLHVDLRHEIHSNPDTSLEPIVGRLGHLFDGTRPQQNPAPSTKSMKRCESVVCVTSPKPSPFLIARA